MFLFLSLPIPPLSLSTHDALGKGDQRYSPRHVPLSVNSTTHTHTPFQCVLCVTTTKLADGCHSSLLPPLPTPQSGSKTSYTDVQTGFINYIFDVNQEKETELFFSPAGVLSQRINLGVVDL